MKPSEEDIKRRSDLISQSKTRNLSRDEVSELQALLTKEARYSYTSGEIGFLAFVCIASIIDVLPRAYNLLHAGDRPRILDQQ